MVDNNTEISNGVGGVVSPTGTPAPSAVEPAVAVPVDGGKVEGGPPSPPEPSPQPSGVWPKSAQDRVAKLTARLRAYEAAGGTPQNAPVDPGTGKQFTPAQIDAMINERATLVANQNTFNSRCNEAAGRGASKFPDWKNRLDGLTQLVDQTDSRSVAQYNLFLEAALETGDAEGIIHRLGSDLNEAARVLAMPPMKMAMEVSKLVQDKGGEPSKAPKPIRPVGSTAPITTVKPDDPERGAEMSMADWITARNKQAAERRIR